MFLDDELLQMCKNTTPTTGKELNALYASLCQKCEDYYKSKIHTFSKDKEVKIVLNRTFNIWDSFVRLAKKDKDKTVNILGEMCEKYHFKNLFLSNPEMKKLYEKL